MAIEPSSDESFHISANFHLVSSFQILEELKQIVNEGNPTDRYDLLQKIGIG